MTVMISAAPPWGTAIVYSRRCPDSFPARHFGRLGGPWKGRRYDLGATAGLSSSAKHNRRKDTAGQASSGTPRA